MKATRGPRPGTTPGGKDPALERALRLLDRRPLTVHEIRSALERQGHGREDIDAAVERLQAAGYVDDLVLATAFVQTRAARLGHSKARLLLDLERRGVARETALLAWTAAVESGDLDPGGHLRDEVRRRVAAAGGALDRKRYARVYNSLLRAGFDPDEVEAALEPYRAGPAS